MLSSHSDGSTFRKTHPRSESGEDLNRHVFPKAERGRSWSEIHVIEEFALDESYVPPKPSPVAKDSGRKTWLEDSSSEDYNYARRV